MNLVSVSGDRARWDGFDCLSDSVDVTISDRVMPLFEEEQVLFCRLASKRVSICNLVLDVGTGCGVLGLWLAAKRNCRVVGVDTNLRALAFVRRNARLNRTPIVASAATASRGCIEPVHADIEAFAMRVRDKYDVILLNPPFTPTCPGFVVASHASAGPCAQGPFETQVKLVPQLLRDGGYCIGYQMSYDKRWGEISAIDRIRDAFGGRARISYLHVLNDKPWFPVQGFLEGQYRKFLSGEVICDGISIADISKYIANAGERRQHFSLIYYEVEKTQFVCLDEPVRMEFLSVPDRRWQDRIGLHRAITEACAKMKVAC